MINLPSAFPLPPWTTPTPDALHHFLSLIENPSRWPILLVGDASNPSGALWVAMAQKSAGLPMADILSGFRNRTRNQGSPQQRQLLEGFIAHYAPGQPVPDGNGRHARSEHPMLRAIDAHRGVILRHTVHDTSRAAADLEEAISAGTSYEIDGNLVRLSYDNRYRDPRLYFVNAHHPLTYRDESHMPFPSWQNPLALHPMTLLPRILQSGVFIKFDFKCPAVVDSFASLAAPFPFAQKMGHMFLQELKVDDAPVPPYQKDIFLTLDDLDRARRLMGGDVPMQVSCFGVTQENLTPALAERFACALHGKAQYINFFLPGRQNPPVAISKMLWEKYGLVTEVKIDSDADKRYWDAQGIPYLGSTNNNALATTIASTGSA